MSDSHAQIERTRLSAYFIGIGGALLSLSVFFPWVNVVLFGNLSLMQLAQMDHRQSSVIVGVIAGALLAVGGFSLKRKTPALVIGAVVTAVIVGLNVFQFMHEVSKYGSLVSLGNGSYLAMLAIVALFVGAFLPTSIQPTRVEFVVPPTITPEPLVNKTNEVGLVRGKGHPTEIELTTVLEKLDRDELTDEEWDELTSADETDPSGMRRLTVGRAFVIGLIAVVLIIAAGVVAYTVKNRNNNTQSNNSTPSTAILLSGLVSVKLPLHVCNTSYGYTAKPMNLPASVNEMVPPGTAGKLVVYTDAQGTMKLLGPSGWDCTAAISGDGWTSETIAPMNSSIWNSYNYNSTLSSGSIVEEISGSGTDSTPTPAQSQACPLFTAAHNFTCSSTAPSSEVINRLTKNVVEFSDPPGVHGDANPSGGAYTARGVMTYFSKPVYEGTSSWMDTCVLPPNEQSLCSALLSNFAYSYGRQ